MISILSCWLFHIPLHIRPIALFFFFFLFYSIYTLTSVHITFSASTQGTIRACCIDHRGEMLVTKAFPKKKKRIKDKWYSTHCTSHDRQHKSTYEKKNMAQSVNDVWNWPWKKQTVASDKKCEKQWGWNIQNRLQKINRLNKCAFIQHKVEASSVTLQFLFYLFWCCGNKQRAGLPIQMKISDIWRLWLVVFMHPPINRTKKLKT